MKDTPTDTTKTAPSKETASKRHEGTVVGVEGDQLRTTCGEGKQHCHSVTKDAKVTCDGKDSKLADLKAGTEVRVTTQKDDKSKATAVDSGKHIMAAANKM